MPPDGFCVAGALCCAKTNTRDTVDAMPLPESLETILLIGGLIWLFALIVALVVEGPKLLYRSVRNWLMYGRRH